LSKYYHRVLIIEKDAVGNDAIPRKGQSHTRHLHGLLPAGLKVMTFYFPSLLEELEHNGANIVDFAGGMHWFTHGGYRKSFQIGMQAVSSSRPLLEKVIRNSVFKEPRIELKDRTLVKKLVFNPTCQCVKGIEIQQMGEADSSILPCDLVIDCSGRGSKSFLWLEELGYKQPSVSEVKVNVGYATRLYEQKPNDPMNNKWIFSTPEAPYEYKSAGAFPVENGCWLVTLAGWHGNHPSTQEESFNNFAKNLPFGDVYRIVSTCKPISDISQYKYSSSLRRHYENLSRFPGSFLVLGDALCSFNPVYGQGMTSAALQIKMLDELLKSGSSKEELASKFFRRAAKIIDIPWKMAVGEDFRFPETIGPKPPGTNIVNKYVTKVHRATLTDEIVCEAFLNVMSLLRSPSSLFHPRIFWRVIRS
jgi:2-polyprenyl-6-methoxyphenol hydroxylase-like FAD-dependent oxidoreductase